jgi:predicted dehydrogenase
MLNVGVIGLGYWGPNIVRNFHAADEMQVTHVCDKSPDLLKKAAKQFPFVQGVLNHTAITRNPEIDIVAVITPLASHYAIAKDALLHGKHVFVEKPFVASEAQALELIALAEQNNLQIMVDYTFLFTGAVRKIKEIIDNGSLGNILYYDSTRVNLGLFQHDCNVVWDLAPHDFSIINYLFESLPVKISAHGMDHFGRGLENIAYVNMYLENQLMANFTFNWLSPVKIRQTLIGGEHKMLVWNDLEADEKLKIYDKGINLDGNTEDIYKMLVQYRSGDIYSPMVEHTEALRLEVEYFRDCILNGEKPINDGYAGLKVVRMLEAVDFSMKNGGVLVDITEPVHG